MHKSNLVTLRLDQIEASSNNPRKHFDAQGLEDLGQSILMQGLMSPLLVRPALLTMPSAGYVLIAGERRWRAAKLKNIESLPCLVTDANEVQALELSIIENLQRENISAMEEAEGYQRWINLSGQSAEALVAKVNKSRSYVYSTLKLLDLNSEVAALVRDGIINRSIGLLISRISDHSKQVDIAMKVQNRQAVYPYHPPGPMSYREALQYIKDHASTPLADAIFELSQPYGGLMACEQCPKRSGNDMLLMAEHDNDPEICSDTACFELKTRRHLEPAAQALRDTGATVIVEEQLPKTYEFMTSYHSFKKGYSSIEKGLGKKHVPNPTTYFLDFRGSKERECIAKKDLAAIIKEHSLGPVKQTRIEPSKPSAKDELEDKAYSAARARWADETLQAINIKLTLGTAYDFFVLAMNLLASDNLMLWDDLPAAAINSRTLKPYIFNSDSTADDALKAAPDARTKVLVIFASFLSPWFAEPGFEDEGCKKLAKQMEVTCEVTEADWITGTGAPKPVPETKAETFEKLFAKKPQAKRGKKAAAAETEPAQEPAPEPA